MRVANHITYASGRSKNVCTSAVLGGCGIHPCEYRYAERPSDVKRILRSKGYSVRSRLSSLPKSASTMSGLKRWLAAGNGDTEARYYVGVKQHAILLSGTGEVLADTAPRKSDRRKVVHVSVVVAGRWTSEKLGRWVSDS